MILQLVNGIAACVAHTYLGSFCLFAALLGQSLTTLLGQWRNTQTDNLTVVFRHDAQIRVDNGLLNDAEHALVPRLDGNGTCVWSVYSRNIIDRYHASV